jgi:hypothetical protein
MNSGMWITFLPSSGCADLSAGWRGAMTPPSRFAAGAVDVAPKHLPK